MALQLADRAFKPKQLDPGHPPWPYLPFTPEPPLTCWDLGLFPLPRVFQKIYSSQGRVGTESVRVEDPEGLSWTTPSCFFPRQWPGAPEVVPSAQGSHAGEGV